MKIQGKTLNDGIWEEIRIYIDPLKDFSGVKLVRKSVRGDRLSIDILSRSELLKLLKRGLEVLERLRKEEERREEEILRRVRRIDIKPLDQF